MDTIILDDYEMIYIPENETPRELLLRVVGYDFTSLDSLDWSDVKRLGLMDNIAHLVATRGKPSTLILKRKE